MMPSQQDASVRATEALDRFEAAWRVAPGPPLDPHLPSPGDAERRAVLLDLVHIDIECRWKAGIGLPVEDYLGRYPELAEDSSVVADLAAWEFELRRRTESGIMADEFVRRFPAQADLITDRLVAVTTAGSGPATYDMDGHALPPSLPPGYEALEELGRGGMGVVLKARQRALGRLVAVKLIRADLSRHPAARARFEAEARAIALLDHPGIVRVHDGGVHDGYPFLVMEHVPGGSLAGRLKAAGPMRPRDAAELVVVLARAVHHAHARRIIHRDLKPANILMGEGGGPKITDFGLARHLAAGSLTVQGDLLGTPAYMAPEQATGESPIGPATDVWGLGAVLYECLTGRPPHVGSTREAVLQQAAVGQVEAPSGINPAIPPALSAICMRALSPDPARRHASAEALAADLERWLRSRVRLMRIALFVALGAVLACAGVAVATWWPPSKPADAGEPLAGELVLEATIDNRRVWVEVTPRDTSAVPVPNGEQIRVRAKLNQEAHIYLMFHDGDSGEVTPLYPWNKEEDFPVPVEAAPADDRPARVAYSPRPGLGGYPMKDASSLDAVILLANRTPLTADLRALIARQMLTLKGARSATPHEVFALDYTGGKLMPSKGWAVFRGKLAAAKATDQPFDDAVRPISERVDVLKAIRFSHWGEKEPVPPRPEKRSD